MQRYMMENADVVVGWLWWAGGPKWGDYVFSLEPKGGVDAPYVARLAPHLAPLTGRVRLTSTQASSYCADVEVYDWAGVKPLAWADATIDLGSATVVSVDGGTPSGASGTITVTPAAENAQVPAFGKRKLSLCASGVADSLGLVAARAK